MTILSKLASRIREPCDARLCGNYLHTFNYEMRNEFQKSHDIHSAAAEIARSLHNSIHPRRKPTDH